MVPAENIDALFAHRDLRTVFHPIVDISNGMSVHGHEALMRGPKGLPFEGPMLAFALAKSLDILEELDLRCIEGALESAPPHGRLFVNLHPTTAARLSADRLVELVARSVLSPSDVVLEIIEHSAGRESHLLQAITRFRTAGFRIAVDDFGEGSSNLRRALRIRPDYLKIDRWFVQGCERDRGRRSAVRLAAQLGVDLGMRVIAEGVENAEQLKIVREAGATLAQGFGDVLGTGGRHFSDEKDEPASPLGGPADADSPVLQRIEDFDEMHLDELPFGVIQLDRDATILQYNRYEEDLTHFRASDVIGRNFFNEIAPCTDVQDFGGRFREGIANGSLHETFDFVFTFDPPKKVRVTLYLSTDTDTIWVFVQER